MGNQNSGHAVLTTPIPPPNWTQSFPRETKRLQKYGVLPEHKVLPEMLPVQRLRSTDNGRILQTKGTLSARQVTVCMPSNQMLYQQQMMLAGPPHSTSMSALNQPGFEPHRQDLHFGRPPTKSFLSEPDLRGPMPSQPDSLQHTIISQSPTKGKIKSKKKYKAPPVPLQNDNYSPRDADQNSDYLGSHHGSDQVWSDIAPHVRGKARKMGLFRKRHEKCAKYFINEESGSKTSADETSIASPPQLSPRDEAQERARSLDCLQHGYGQSSPVSMNSITDLNQSTDPRPWVTLERDSAAHRYQEKQSRSSSSGDSQPNSGANKRHQRKHQAVVSVEKQVDISQHRTECKDALPSNCRQSRLDSYHHVSGMYIPTQAGEKVGEWESCDVRIDERNETPVKKLAPVAPVKQSTITDSPVIRKEKMLRPVPNESPRQFYFGMEPKVSGDEPVVNAGMLKIKKQDEMISKGSIVVQLNTSEANNNGGQERRNLELRKKCEDMKADPRKLSRDVDEFASAIERHKTNHVTGEDEVSGSSRREDGGYHSRQNSGSFSRDEQVDQEQELNIKLRPTLPRRLLEIPRFSPNAAWRSLTLDSTPQNSILNESHSSEEADLVFEASILRVTNPTAPPRGSGEKSADSGISGDAGSPGPMQEFEPLPGNKNFSGPLAVSSPVASGGRPEVRRAWTPAQDLDDNSIDGSADHHIIPGDLNVLAVPPKLTSRSNMFSKVSCDPDTDSPEDVDSMLDAGDIKYINDDKKDLRQHRIGKSDGQPQKYNILCKLRQHSVSNSINGMAKIEDSELSAGEDQVDSDWRDNWSMSRSIPTSLNHCDENESRGGRSRSESRIGMDSVESCPRTPGGAGHIMYLPEYNSLRVLRDEDDNFSHDGKESSRSIVPHHSVRPLTPDGLNRKLPSADESTDNGDSSYGPSSLPASIASTGLYIRSAKKSKKFSYQSTVRVLEKKKLGEKLAREIAEKEKQRLKEVEAMKKVEEEFQNKREREKKRLKQQLKLMQMQQIRPQDLHHSTSFSSDDLPPSTLYSDIPPSTVHSVTTTEEQHDVSSQSSFQVTNPSQMEVESYPVYTSLPPVLVEDSPPGLLKGWMKKGRRESRSSSTSTSTVTLNAPRQDPDGAPASSPPNQDGDFRSKIIAASKKGNGQPVRQQENVRKSLYRHFNELSETESNCSRQESSRRSVSPRMGRSSRESSQSRDYREYRSPVPSFASSSSAPPALLGDNYRREFCYGNALVIGPNVIAVKSKRNAKEPDLMHSNEGRRSRSSSRNGQVHPKGIIMGSAVITNAGSSSSSLQDHRQLLPSHYHQKSSSSTPVEVRYSRMYSSAVDSSPARFAHNLMIPFNPTRTYRPVSFSPPTSNTVLPVK